MKIIVMFLTLLAFGLASGTSSADIFKWIDENGVIHYSDSPTRKNIPESIEQEETVNSRQPNDNHALPTAEDPKAALNPDVNNFLNETEEAPVFSEEPTVEIYVTSWCRYCEKAKRFFRSKGIEFEVYDVEKDQKAARRMRSMTSNRGVPFVVINGQGITGYSAEAYELALQN